MSNVNDQARENVDAFRSVLPTLNPLQRAAYLAPGGARKFFRANYSAPMAREMTKVWDEMKPEERERPPGKP